MFYNKSLYKSNFGSRRSVGSDAVDLVVDGLAGYGVNLLQSSDAFSSFDLFDPDSGLLVEVKRRSFVFGKYPSVFFPVNKFVSLASSGFDCLYINVFDDGLYGALVSDLVVANSVAGFPVNRAVYTPAFVIPNNFFRFFSGFGELSEVFKVG